MFHRHKFYCAVILGLIGELILPGYIAIRSVQAAETASEENTGLASIIMRQRSLNLIGVTPVSSEGQNLGLVKVYDDPSTKRRTDYLELYDSEGELVAIGWFDQFGIQRLAVDRAFVEGTGGFQRIFVTVVNGDFI